MRVGFDFDNTIVSYDALFHKVALEQSLVPPQTPVSKVAVRDYLRKVDREHEWTEMQGYVYGSRMAEAAAYPGVVEFIQMLRDRGIDVLIISHKTKFPFLGPKYDLHAAAADWISASLSDSKGPLFASDRVFFELTKEEKIARIAACACDYFIDDLPEILQMSGFPADTGRLLFDPEKSHDDQEAFKKFGSWQEIRAYFENR